MASPVIDMEEDLAALFGDDDDFEDDDFSDDDSEGVEEEEVWEVHLLWLMRDCLLPSQYLDFLEYGHGKLVKKVIQVSDVEVATGVSIKEIDSRVLAIEGQVQVMAS
nr:hypothetical protein [Tanacetum cinerariifolium]